MADNGVRIDVGFNISKAERDLEKLRDKIAKTEAQLNANTSRKSVLEEQLRNVGYQADEAKRKVVELKEQLGQARSREDKAAIRGQLADATEEQRILAREVNRISDEFTRVSNSIDEGNANLVEMQDEAGELSRQIAAARPGEIIVESLKNAKKSMMTFLKYAFGIRSLFFLFRRLRNTIKEAVSAFAEGDADTKATIDDLKKALEQLKLSWGAAFAPILNVVAPLIKTLIGYLVDAANAISRFVALLGGKGSYKKAVLKEVAEGMDNIAGAAGGAAEATEEAKRQLMGFDELNILNADKSNGSGSGGAAGSSNPNFDLVEEALDPFDDSFLTKLALSMKDVLFDWSDLTPEQIAEKVIAGLATGLGAALAISLGMGPGGVILMTIAGLALGLVADALTFDHDGRLSKTEIMDMILLVANGFVGGVAGFIFAPPGAKFKGAMIGATVATGLTLAIKAIRASGDLKSGGIGESFLNVIVDLLQVSLPAAIGIKVGMAAGTAFGGIAGGVIGLLVGVGLTMMVQQIRAELGARDAFYSTDFGKSVSALKEELQDSMQVSLDLKAHINSITGEVDESTLADLSAAQALIDKIFTLDEKEGKTSEEMQLLVSLVERLNGMGLSGVFLTFEEATGHISQTRQEIQLTTQELLRQYQIQAMGEAYVAALKAQYTAENDRTTAVQLGRQAVDDYQTAVDNLRTAESQLADARNAYNQDAIAGEAQLRMAEQAVKTAEEGVKAAKANAEGADKAIKTAIENVDLAAEKVTSIEKAFTDLVEKGGEAGTNTAEGFAEKITEGAKAAEQASQDMGEDVISALQDILQTHSPSKVTQEIGANTAEGFEKGIKDNAPDVAKAAEEVAKGATDKFQETADGTRRIFESMRNDIATIFSGIVSDISNNINQMRQLMNFTWEIPRPRIPQIGANILTVRYGNGQYLTLPQFYVNWYAKGGIFDDPSLIGVGENGKEAVVPLEKNTEWMRTVADGLVDRLKKNDFANQVAAAFASVPRPAMASGNIAPPNAVYSRYSGGDASIMAELAELKNAIRELASQPIQVNSKMYLDKRQVGQSVTEFQRQDSIARGK